MNTRRLLVCLGVALAGCLASWLTHPAYAYIEAPYTLGRIVFESSKIIVLRVEKVDKEKNLFIY
jgi:hypothetical protein